jgi:L-lactate dehydrogenase complex protein LldF
LYDHGYKKNVSESLAWKGWEMMNTSPTVNSFGQKMLGIIGSKLPNVGPLKYWTRTRTQPKFAAKSLHELVKKLGVDNE